MTAAGNWRKITPHALFPCGESIGWDRDLLYYCGDTFAGIGVAERRK